MKPFIAAISTLTRLPISRQMTFSDEALSASLFYFPAVGLGIGALLLGLTRIFTPSLSPLPLAAALLCVSVLMTGGLHLDGLADLCDGLGAGGTPTRILAVMKDSHIGAFGVIALVLALIFKFALFHEIIIQRRFNTFLLMGLLSRWSMVLAAFLGKYPRETGTGLPFIGKGSWQRALTTSGLTAVLSFFILKETGLFAMLLSIALTFAFVRYLRHKIGGLTGDGLGALNEIAEVLVLLVALR